MVTRMITEEMLKAGLRVYYELQENPELMVKCVYRAMKNVEDKSNKLTFGDEHEFNQPRTRIDRNRSPFVVG